MTRYLGLAEFFWLAEQVTGLDTTILVKASRVKLADSALHAPQAGYGDEDFYPDIYDKAAVLTCRIALESSAARWQQARGVGVLVAVRRSQWWILGSGPTRRRRGCPRDARCGGAQD